MNAQPEPTDEDLLERAIEARLDYLQIEEDRAVLPGSLSKFIQAAFPQVKPGRPYKHNWHLDVSAAHLEAVTAGEINRLQIWQPPGTMKSMTVHVFWPVWEWITRPEMRYWCASHSLSLVWQHCEDSGTLLKSEWFRDRWPDIEMRNVSTKGYTNSVGATRFTTSPDSEGVGKHGDRIILDDLLDAGDAESTTRAVLEKTNGWYDLVIMGRKESGAAEVLIMQRLHEDDIAAHALEVGDWTVLCLPERFEDDHPFAWRGDMVHPAVAARLEGTGLEHGDPRTDGDLLWPEHRNSYQSDEYARRLGPHKAAGQLQQRPAAREGELLKVAWWRFYNPEIRAKEEWSRLPKFRTIVISVDTPLKDKESSDNVSVQCYGVYGADRYLLDLRLAKMNKGRARREITEMWRWARKHWRAPLYVLIENAGYGVELIDELKREITGVQKISPGAEGNKQLRAESAADALESGNYFLPGFGPPWQPAYDETKSPADVAAFIHSCALFPNARHDDDVDSWSQAGIWIGRRQAQPARTISPFKTRTR